MKIAVSSYSFSQALYDGRMTIMDVIPKAKELGYDGIESGRYTIPRLSTIRQDTETLARKGVEDLLLRINYSHPITHEDISFALVEGESVGKPRKRREIRGK